MHGGIDRKPLAVLALAALPLVSCGEPDRCADAVPGTVCAVAGTGESGFNDDGKPPDETDFFRITRARRGPDGLLYFMDFNNWRIRRLDDDGLVRTIAGNGWHAPGIDGAVALESPLDNPTDFDFLPDGSLVTVSLEDPRILQLKDGRIHVIAGSDIPGIRGDEGDGSGPLQARFIELMGIAVAPDGTIYVSDSKANRVRAIRDDIVSTVAGTGEAGYSGDGGSAFVATLNYPSALAIDERGNLYIADSLNHAIRRVDPSGDIETVAGTGVAGLGGDGAPATEAMLDEPFGLDVDSSGSIYIADRQNFRVRRVDPSGIIETIAGSDEGYGGDGGPALKARFGYLARITLDGDRLLVADQTNGCIRAIVLGE